MAKYIFRLERMHVNFQRGKITEVTAGPRWRVKHHANLAHASPGLFDVVGGKDETEAVEQVNSAYPKRRVIISAEFGSSERVMGMRT